MIGWEIRDEQFGDEPAVAALIEAAFREMPHGDGGEATIVLGLRAAGDLALSLVAVNADRAIVGHIAFSPVRISDGTPGWYGLGPVAVIPPRQRAGIGAAMIREGLDRLERSGANGCVVLGEPDYYTRFGFEHDSALIYPGPPREYFQRKAFGGRCPTGIVTYTPAFG